MSGASVPYHLRPHKSVDRRLFLDLLTRYERWQPLAESVYLSMGGYPLEDHKLLHRHLGITRLIAFDLEDEIVARQKFNKPIDTCHCVTKKSDEVISEIDSLLQQFGVSDRSSIIFWLDYTSPSQIGKQIREFEGLLNKLKAGDIVRVTVNAHPNSLSEPEENAASRQLAEEKKIKRLQKLKQYIRDFLPPDVSADDMTMTGLPNAISRSFGAAASKALPASGENMFCPLSIIRYADGLQMLSITGTIIKRADKVTFLEKIDLASWPFGSTDWSSIHRLIVPSLTIRERLFLEKGILSRSPAELVAELGFNEASDIKMDEFLDNYKYYYRFYPTLFLTDV